MSMSENNIGWGTPRLTNEKLNEIYSRLTGKASIPQYPTTQELKDLLAALMWTTGLQDDIDKFLEKYPHLRP